MSKFACPCCGNLTLTEEGTGTFEICPVCCWENDKVQFEEPELAAGANSVSLKQARENYHKFGAATKECLPNVRPPTHSEIPAHHKK